MLYLIACVVQFPLMLLFISKKFFNGFVSQFLWEAITRTEPTKPLKRFLSPLLVCHKNLGNSTS